MLFLVLPGTAVDHGESEPERKSGRSGATHGSKSPGAVWSKQTKCK